MADSNYLVSILILIYILHKKNKKYYPNIPINVLYSKGVVRTTYKGSWVVISYMGPYLLVDKWDISLFESNRGLHVYA
jgi:hypothetical protein